MLLFRISLPLNLYMECGCTNNNRTGIRLWSSQVEKKKKNDSNIFLWFILEKSNKGGRWRFQVLSRGAWDDAVPAVAAEFSGALVLNNRHLFDDVMKVEGFRLVLISLFGLFTSGSCTNKTLERSAPSL